MDTQKPVDVVIIGAGTGGTIVANRLNRKLGKRANITVIDPTFKHIYQPGYLFVMIGREKPENLVVDGRKLLPKRANLVQDKVIRVDTQRQVVITDKSGEFHYDYLVLASGSRIVPEELEWWDDTVHHFYSGDGALRLSHALEEFKGGKIVVAIADLPYKCPPAPIEAALLIDDYFRRKKMRDKVEITYASPLNRAFSIETTNTVIEPLLEKRGVKLVKFFNVDEADTEEKVLYSVEGDELEYDLLILIPPHKGQQYLIESNLSDKDGWVPVDKYTLQVKDHPNIYAIGDTTNLPISKAGSAAHHEAPVIVKNIARQVKGEPPKPDFHGHVQCFILTKWGSSMFIDFDYNRPPKPGKSRKHWWWFKRIFKQFYFKLVVKGYV